MDIFCVFSFCQQQKKGVILSVWKSSKHCTKLNKSVCNATCRRRPPRIICSNLHILAKALYFTYRKLCYTLVINILGVEVVIYLNPLFPGEYVNLVS